MYNEKSEDSNLNFIKKTLSCFYNNIFGILKVSFIFFIPLVILSTISLYWMRDFNLNNFVESAADGIKIPFVVYLSLTATAILNLMLTLSIIFYTFKTIFLKKADIFDVFADAISNLARAIYASIIKYLGLISFLFFTMFLGAFLFAFLGNAFEQLFLILLLILFTIFHFYTIFSLIAIVIIKSRAVHSLAFSITFVSYNSPKILFTLFLTTVVSALIALFVYLITSYFMAFLSVVFEDAFNIMLSNDVLINICTSISTMLASSYFYSSLVFIFTDMKAIKNTGESA